MARKVSAAGARVPINVAIPAAAGAPLPVSTSVVPIGTTPLPGVTVAHVNFLL